MARLFYVARTIWHEGDLHIFRKKVDTLLPIGTRVPFLTRKAGRLRHDIVTTIGDYTHFLEADPERDVEAGDIFMHLRFHPDGETYEDDDKLTFTEWLSAQEGWESSRAVY